MNFSDIFKSSFIENIASVSMLDMAIAMALAFLIGIFIFFVYQRCGSYSDWRPYGAFSYAYLYHLHLHRNFIRRPARHGRYLYPNAT